ncbi:hypothetical protein [Hymenobacter sp.]|jgi:hypothetical protein|uniref:hypothetical protein n=1 Tax=Hymenobacter sp. TaxID=1898978 RepID=UPI002ED93E4A
MRYVLLLFILFFNAQLAQSQVFEPGYLVLSNGDTLRGEVENAFWADPPTTVRFRSTSTSRLTTYSTRQLRSMYLATGRLLRQEWLPVDRTATTTVTNLPTAPISNQQSDSIFADVLVIGPATLLGVTLTNVNHFFVRREGQPYMEMTERNYLVKQDGTMRVADGNDYKSQLLRYFGDCEAATKVSAKAPFTADGMKAVVQAYNQQCSAARLNGQEIITDRRRGKVAVRIGVVGGLRFNSLVLDGKESISPTLGGLNADGQGHALGGAYIDIVNPGRRLALHTAVLASRFGRSKPMPFGQRFSSNTGSFEWYGTLVNLQLGLRGFVPIGARYKLMVGGGYEINSYHNQFSALQFGNQQYPFLGGLTGSLLPYLETGLSRDRLTLLVSGRLYAEQGFFYDGIIYSIRPWSISTALSFRLNSNPDKQTRQ